MSKKSLRERLAGNLGLSVPLGLSLDDMEKVYYMLDESELQDSKGNSARIDVIRRRIIIRANEEGLYDCRLVRNHIQKQFNKLCSKNKVLIPNWGKAVFRQALNNASALDLYHICPTQFIYNDRFLNFVRKVIASSEKKLPHGL